MPRDCGLGRGTQGPLDTVTAPSATSRMLIKLPCDSPTVNGLRFLDFNIFGEHKTTEQTKVLSVAVSPCRGVFRPSAVLRSKILLTSRFCTTGCVFCEYARPSRGIWRGAVVVSSSRTIGAHRLPDSGGACRRPALLGSRLRCRTGIARLGRAEGDLSNMHSPPIAAGCCSGLSRPCVVHT